MSAGLEADQVLLDGSGTGSTDTTTRLDEQLKCSRCHQLKPRSEFHKSTKRKTGASPWCKACSKEHLNAGPNQPLVIATCVICGRAFESRNHPSRNLSSTCSKDCRWELRRRRSTPKPIPAEKKCTVCGEVKPIDQFYTLKSHRPTSGCKSCHVVNATEWAKENRDRKKMASWAWRINKDYGLSVKEYLVMYERQAGKCAVCLRELELYGKFTSIDHNHTTGAVRGLLCRQCNSAAGLLSDSSSVARRLAEYLDKHRPVEV